MNNKLTQKKEEGFSLVEVILYMAVLAVVVTILIGSLTVMAEVQEKIAAGKAVDRSAVVALDRLLRETRLSDSIDMGNSFFNEDESVLVLNREEESGNVSIVFYVSADGHLHVEKGGVDERLTHKNTNIKEFRLIEVDSGEMDAVRVRVTIGHPYSEGEIEQTFYSTAILRGSYK